MKTYYIVKQITDGKHQQYSAGLHFISFDKENACLYGNKTAAESAVLELNYQNRERGFKFEVEELTLEM